MRTYYICVLILMIACTSASDNKSGLINNKEKRTIKKPNKRVFRAGEYIQNATLATIEGTEVELYDLLQQKDYWVIKMWATWCAACKKEEGDWVKRKVQFENAKVGFMTVSTDAHYDAWKKYVNSRNWKGEHYWIGNEEHNPLSGLLNSKGPNGKINAGLPQYKLIDKSAHYLTGLSRPQLDLFEDILLKSIGNELE